MFCYERVLPVLECSFFNKEDQCVWFPCSLKNTFPDFIRNPISQICVYSSKSSLLSGYPSLFHTSVCSPSIRLSFAPFAPSVNHSSFSHSSLPVAIYLSVIHPFHLHASIPLVIFGHHPTIHSSYPLVNCLSVIHPFLIPLAIFFSSFILLCCNLLSCHSSISPSFSPSCPLCPPSISVPVAINLSHSSIYPLLHPSVCHPTIPQSIMPLSLYTYEI